MSEIQKMKIKIKEIKVISNCLSITQFCEEVGISRATYNNLCKANWLTREETTIKIRNFCEKNNIDFDKYCLKSVD